MKDSSRIVYLMGWALSITVMEPSTQEIGRMVSKMAKESIISVMVTFTKEI